MGFKKTSEGRVFFKSPDNDDGPLSQALANSEPLVPKDNTQMQILLLLKSLNTKLKASREDQEILAKDLQAFKDTVTKLEKKTPITGKISEPKQLAEAKAKIKALEEKFEQQGSHYIDLEQQVARKQNEVSKKTSRVEDSVKKALKLVEHIKESAASDDSAVQALKEDIEKQRKAEETILKKQKALEETQKDQGEKMVDNVAAYVALTKRVSNSEERHDTLENKIADSASDYIKLDRKIDKVIEDRNRILRKVERIEQAVLETRDALNAKAMVLLTDQGAVAGVDVPQIGDSATQTDPMALQKRLEEEALMPWWRKPMRLPVASLVMMGVIILLLGYIISALQYGRSPAPVDIPSEPARVSVNVAPPKTETLIEAAEAPLLTEPIIEQDIMEGRLDTAKSEIEVQDAEVFEPQFGIAEGEGDPVLIQEEGRPIDVNNQDSLNKAFNQDPQGVAQALNEIEPSSLPAADQGVAQVNALQTHQTAAYKAGLRQRIQPDRALEDLAKKIETQAFDGVPEAQHDMGAIYVAGHGKVKQNLKRAVAWFTEASNNGVANATYNLGVLHHRGLGMDADLPRAMQLYQKAADQGHGEAQYNLGIAHIEGVGTAYNPAKAAQFFEGAARQGVTEAAYNLGLIYENGLLGRAEPGRALSWYKYAAAQGSPEAQSALNQLAASLSISVEDVNSIVETVRSSNGDNNALISRIQEELMERGFYPGPVDGQIGPVTRSSIRAFQLAAELPIDGEPSQTLLDVLSVSRY